MPGDPGLHSFITFASSGSDSHCSSVTVYVMSCGGAAFASEFKRRVRLSMRQDVPTWSRRRETIGTYRCSREHSVAPSFDVVEVEEYGSVAVGVANDRRIPSFITSSGKPVRVNNVPISMAVVKNLDRITLVVFVSARARAPNDKCNMGKNKENLA